MLEADQAKPQLVDRVAHQVVRPLVRRVEGRTVLVDAPDERPYDLVRDTIDQLGLGLVRLEHRRHRLEDLFRGDGTNSGQPLQESEAGTPAGEATS